MGYQEFWHSYREEVRERFPLVEERLKQIMTEDTVANRWREYFQSTAAFLGRLCALYEEIIGGDYFKKSLKQLQTENHALYEEILPQNYAKSYANPAYAAGKLGEAFGKLLRIYAR